MDTKALPTLGKYQYPPSPLAPKSLMPNGINVFSADSIVSVRILFVPPIRIDALMTSYFPVSVYLVL